MEAVRKTVCLNMSSEKHHKNIIEISTDMDFLEKKYCLSNDLALYLLYYSSVKEIA